MIYKKKVILPIKFISHGCIKITRRLETLLYINTPECPMTSTLDCLSVITVTNPFSTNNVSPGFKSRPAIKYRPRKSETHSSIPSLHATPGQSDSGSGKKAVVASISAASSTEGVALVGEEVSLESFPFKSFATSWVVCSPLALWADAAFALEEKRGRGGGSGSGKLGTRC